MAVLICGIWIPVSVYERSKRVLMVCVVLPFNRMEYGWRVVARIIPFVCGSARVVSASTFCVVITPGCAQWPSPLMVYPLQRVGKMASFMFGIYVIQLEPISGLSP